jgi:hypothetical protein
MRLYISLSALALLLMAGQAFACSPGQLSSSTAICGCTGNRVSIEVCKVSSTGGCQPGAISHHCSDECSLNYAESCTVTSSNIKVDDRLEASTWLASRASTHSQDCAALSGASLEEWVSSHRHAKATVAEQGKEQTGY